MQRQLLQVDDGTQLALRIYEPIGPQRASIVIGGAMGVRQAFYQRFAQWLALPERPAHDCMTGRSGGTLRP